MNTVVKKVAAYPIPCQLIANGSTVAAQVMRVTPSACLISAQTPLIVNRVYNIKFEFPVTRSAVDEEVMVFKTYDEFAGKHGQEQAGYHTAELLFRRMTDNGRRAIANFLARLGVPRPV
jgi:hypothetical protein